MKAGIVYIKVLIDSIEYEETPDDVSGLKESIKKYGLMQPVGIVKTQVGFRLVFGKRRIKACRELNMKYIHCVLLTLKNQEEIIFSLHENIYRKNTGIKEITESFLKLNSANAEDLLLTNQERIKEYLLLSPNAKEFVNSDTERFLDFSDGNSDLFIKMCKLYQSIPKKCAEKVRLSVLSDKRIFINEIEKIVTLMRRGGFEEFVSENEEQIIISKKNKAV